ncbi:TonB-dependent receptor [Dysgonomonas sp. BGC7]|nr:TonB-dependent receptor [Dysgonomonas sp. BGC7]
MKSYMKISEIINAVRYKHKSIFKTMILVTASVFCSANSVYAISDRNEISEIKETAQSAITITGLVTDGDGNPLIGVTVSVKGTTTGVMTDLEGRYSIRVPEGKSLEFTYIGFNTETREIKKGETSINIRMVESSVDLEDVVIIGYGQQKKESVVSAINTVTSKELAVTGRSLANSIAGQIAGVIAIQPSGEPGYDDSNFWIRGVSSFAGGTNPLIVVDGVPRGSFSNIPVDEIETFTVLKDAAATAVYGAEGANGVVLVTTKRGKAQKTAISFNMEQTMKTPIRLPEILDSYRTLNLYNEARWNDDGNPLRDWVAPFSDETLEKYRTGADPDLYPNTNWMDLLKDHTYTSRYTINFRGGGDKVRFFVSGAYYTEDGIYKGNPIEDYDANLKYERYNLRSNIDMDITKTTKMSVDMSGFYVQQNAPRSSADRLFSAFTIFPTYLIPMVYSDGTFSDHPLNTDVNAERANPYNLLNNVGYTKNWEVTVQTRVGLEQKLDIITKGLSWKGAVSFDSFTQGRIDRAKEAQSFFAEGRDADGKLILKQIKAGSALANPTSSASSGEKKIYLETSLNYDRLFAEKHAVTGLILYNQKESQYQRRDNGIEMLPYRKQSVVARGTYGFDNRYYLEASFGMTGSENFAKGHRWGFFPAVGAAWTVSQESFMKSAENTLSKLRFRVSYGRTGNDQLSNDLSRFPYREKVNEGASGYPLGITQGSGGGGTNNPGNGIVESDYATPLLKWEIEDKFNLGMDLGLLRGKVDLGIDYFRNNRHAILMRRNTIPSAAGLRVSPMQNFGKTENQGIDASLVVRHEIGNVSLAARGNITYTKNKVIEYDEIPQVYKYQQYTGNSIGQPLLYIAEGLYTPDDFIITTDPHSKKQTYKLKEGLPVPGAIVSPGDIKYRDLNGDGVIDTYDRTYDNGFYPSSSPGIVYGFGLNAEWKGFNVGVFFQGVTNVSANLLNKVENFVPFVRGVEYQSVRTEGLNRWRSEDPYNQDVIYPRLHSTSFSNNLEWSTWWHRDASFLRLKNIEFGYTFEKKLVQKVKLEGIRLYVQGQNLHTWDNIKFWDPELRDARSGAKYPMSASWTLGLDVTF